MFETRVIPRLCSRGITYDSNKSLHFVTNFGL